MKRQKLLIVSVLTAAMAVAGLAIAHSDGDKAAYGGFHGGFHGGHMGMGGMGMGGMGMMGASGAFQPMFNLEKMTQELNLSDEQISILSQLEASHIQLQTEMQAVWQENDGSLDHGRMMSVMTDNYDLMTAHQDLYQQFEDSLTDEQSAQWSGGYADCH